MKKVRKLELKSQTVRNLSAAQLGAIGGGVTEDSNNPYCQNTVLVCVDTQQARCRTTTGGGTATCPAATFTCGG